MKQWLLPVREGESAQGVIEFALISIIMIFVMLGIIDFSRFMYFQSAIDGAARSGAEVALNHCPAAYTGNTCPGSTWQDFTVQAAVCQAATTVTLQPQVSCAPCDGTGTACPDPCAVTACPACTASVSSARDDVCVTGSYATHSNLTVGVGYPFSPYTPFIAPFFPSISCWSGDSTSVNHHTICSKSTARVS